MADITPFSFVSSVSENKKDLSEHIKAYMPWILNIALCRFFDTVIQVNEMNRLSHLPNIMQYKYLLHVLRPRRRWEKWIKSNNEDKDLLKAVMNYYECGFKDAEAAIELLSKDQINNILGIKK